MSPRPAPYTLHFDAKLATLRKGKELRDGLSSALRTGDNLWLAGDETANVERLRLAATGHRFGQHTTFRLGDFLDMPDPDEAAEADIEGLAECDGYLWVIGSHSLCRKQPDDNSGVAEGIKELTKVQADANRFLLARIPLVQNADTEDYELHKKAPRPGKEGRLRRAARLGRRALARALAHDPHLGPFLKVPSKENGFDIEGLAAAEGGRLFVGLRGPVVRGWAVVLELRVKAGKRRGRLKLGKIPGAEHTYYRKHFLDLGGMGLRELRCVGNDLYLLAGPTMDLDGTIAVYCWPGALQHTTDSLVSHQQLRRLFDVPHGFGPTAGQDRAEGMALLDAQHILITFDSPAKPRHVGAHDVLADCYPLTAEPAAPAAKRSARPAATTRRARPSAAGGQ
ncbi:DUF3616 domain-containing protein [Hymenobacter busanensis]|uniref:DUF3616 domain-containing protein n=1 Tax=Hymenobacter busanensis TaxID=2607656 RepID=A0A7L4ZYC6_9BACT|nr:DUF3616 domain-containing protein [Hymenobacter busanensis]KAA9333286.1 DUF3616 domain-containing protein [Hymenobacter busanensis]QHJ08037.1 DUF3616 domain-containing protein [Hymenobacter busanensis]